MLEHYLRVIGSDETSIMTGEYNGAIRKLEELCSLCSGLYA